MRIRAEPAVTGAAAAYVLVVGWAMASLSYDVWGALVVGPVIVLVTVPIVRRVFSGELAHLFPLAALGIPAKIAGSCLRYWVAFDAYGGASDSASYHAYAAAAAEQIRSGNASLSAAIPRGTGTVFIERLTTMVYTVFGSSKLAGFLLFAWMGYWGAVLFVRAACMAVPGLATTRYAALVFFTPTMLFWPSSIGKEAWICLCLGLASYGVALMVTRRWRLWAIVLTAAGIAGAGFGRPHFAALWAGALAVALLAGFVTGSSGRGAAGRMSTVFLLGLTVIGLLVVAAATLKYLNPSEVDEQGTPFTEQVSTIFQETERRTAAGDSSFTPVVIRGPVDWPEAVARTLTRPLLDEARDGSQMFTAIEMSLLVAWLAIGWRRLAMLPRLMARMPYLVFAVVVLVMFGLAFARIGNLGILARQRSLVTPFLLLLLCLPERAHRSTGVRVSSLGAPATSGARG